MTDASQGIAQPVAELPTGIANLAEAGLLFSFFLGLGAVGMLPTTRALLTVWTGDPLRSFGSLIPFVSVAFLLRAWKSVGWNFRPHPAGAVLIALAVALSRAADGAIVTYRAGDIWLDPLQPALPVCAYFAGVALLLGGVPLLRRSAFALCLLLCVNPVPHVLTAWVDFPLQRASATVARSFAHLLGLYPTGEQLQLMFTPRFGMQIIPGCNGMRGAATMAYVTLILSYLRGYRLWRIAALTVGAALLGYLLNFLRLCLLVVYYAVGFRHPAMRGDGTTIDYLIGGCLFLLVSTLAGALWLRGRGGSVHREEPPVPWPALLRRPLVATTLLLLFVAAAIEAPTAWGLRHGGESVVTPETAFAALPVRAGNFTRDSAPSTQVLNGTPVWMWATYRSGDDRVVDLGVWLLPTQHFALKSRQMRGVQPEWMGSLQAHAEGGRAVQAVTYTVTDDLGTQGGGEEFFAETTCTVSLCSARASGFSREGLSVAVGPSALAGALRLPLAFRITHPPGRTTSPESRSKDEAAIVDLLMYLDTSSLARRLGYR